MTSGKRWGIEKQKRLLFLGKTRGLRLSSTQWNQPRLIEIYLPFTLKKSFCTLYHELCPWGQATRIFRENTVCKGFQNGGMIWKCMVALKEWLLSCYASLREREQHVCSSYWVWKGWGLSWGTGWKETYCIRLADGGLMRHVHRAVPKWGSGTWECLWENSIVPPAAREEICHFWWRSPDFI